MERQISCPHPHLGTGIRGSRTVPVEPTLVNRWWTAARPHAPWVAVFHFRGKQTVKIPRCRRLEFGWPQRCDRLTTSPRLALFVLIRPQATCSQGETIRADLSSPG